MEIKQLEYMTMAAQMGSFNKASELLYTTQSNVSKVIRNLENELGYSIFRRQGSGVVLTEGGRALYDQAMDILSLVKNIELSSNMAHKTCFHISSIPSNLVAMHFAQFVADYDDGICFKMCDGDIGYVIDQVDKGEAELGFLYICEDAMESFGNLIGRKGLKFSPIRPAQVEICVGPNHRLAHRQSVTLSELSELRYVRMAEDQVSRTYHLNYLEHALQLDKSQENVMEVGSSYALMNILARTDRVELCYGDIRDNDRIGILGIRAIPVEISEKIYMGYISKKDQPLSELAVQFMQQFCET